MNESDDEAPEKAKKVVKHPDDFASAEAFLEHIRKTAELDLAADKDNRMAGLEDSKFFVGDQWPQEVRARRESGFKPVLTENYLPAFVAQVTGNRRLNETVIKISPDSSDQKHKRVAEVREGLIRSIQKNSRAKIAYDGSNQNQVVCGIGNFQALLVENTDDVFIQDAVIADIPNPFAVVWDRMAFDPTGRDATRVMVYEDMDATEFKHEYPHARACDVESDYATWSEMVSGQWIGTDTVRIASYWRMRTRKRMLALFIDGQTKDVTDKPDEEYGSQLVRKPDGSPYKRLVDRKYAEMYLVTGCDLLAGPYELPISRVPVFRVPGWIVNEGEKRHRWGLIRFLKDPSRLHNYWQSIKAEKLMMTPKARWVASDAAVQGREKEWREAHRSDDALLIYNGEAGQPPEFTPPAQMEQALVLEAESTKQALKDISNLHEASLGQQSNEVSGKAIVARQRVGELGTVLYQDNLNAAIEECGRVLNELIPIVYDTPRVIKIIGPDEKESMVPINDGTNPAGVDITLGKYSVTVSTGPSYVTKRLESRESMETVFNSAPQLMAPFMDIWFEAFDFPGADKMVERARQNLPAGTVPDDELTDEQKQAQADAAAAQQKTAALAAGMAQAQLAKAEAEVKEVEARTELAHAQADRARAEPRLQAAADGVKAKSTLFNDHITAIETATAGEERVKSAGAKK